MKNLYRFLFGLLALFLLLAGIGRQLFLVKLAGVLVSFLILLIVRLFKNKLKLPRYFKLWLGFFGLLTLSLFWTKDFFNSLEQGLLFLAGSGFWLVGYNLKKEWVKYFEWVLVSLGLVMAGVWGYYQFIIGDLPVVPWGLWGHYSGYKNHLMLGDYWSVVLGLVIVGLVEKPKDWVRWLLLMLGGYLVLASQSRSALVGLLVGVGYLVIKNKSKYQKSLKMMGVVLMGVFFWFALNKSTLLVRDYYLQSLMALKTYPWGVGMGNFKFISEDQRFHLWGRDDLAYNAHSLVFEMISGLGWLSIVFVGWWYKVVKMVWEKKRHGGMGYRVAFLVMTVNFLLFSSYFQPTMLWLWFLLLGVVE